MIGCAEIRLCKEILLFMRYELETPRLRIVPLLPAELERLLAGMKALETALGLNPGGQELDGHTREAMQYLYHLGRETPDSFPWITNWQIILKRENIAVGSACFMNVPNAAGEVEVGYGIHPPFRGSGYMSEALEALCRWALAQPGVDGVTAQTGPDNVPSHRVLTRCGFFGCGPDRFLRVSESPAVRAAAAMAAMTASGRDADAKGLQRFFKTGPGQYGAGDRFLGVRNPQSRKVAKAFRRMAPAQTEQLLQSPWHEIRLVGLLILVEQYRRGNAAERAEILELYLRNIAWVNNWDLVDLSSPGIVGEHVLSHGTALLDALADRPNLWAQRIAVLATLTLIRHGEFAAAFRLAERFLGHPHDLMHKACGWMLREIGKRDRAALTDFLERRRMTMPRTMLRYAIERYPEAARRAFLKR